jgi:hypothetical protein
MTSFFTALPFFLGMVVKNIDNSHSHNLKVSFFSVDSRGKDKKLISKEKIFENELSQKREILALQNKAMPWWHRFSTCAGERPNPAAIFFWTPEIFFRLFPFTFSPIFSIPWPFTSTLHRQHHRKSTALAGVA